MRASFRLMGMPSPVPVRASRPLRVWVNSSKTPFSSSWAMPTPVSLTEKDKRDVNFGIKLDYGPTVVAEEITLSAQIVGARVGE